MNRIEIIFMVGVIILATFSAYSMFKLVQLDSKSRGMKNPTLWGLFFGLNSNSLLAYLFLRNDVIPNKLTEEEKDLMKSHKLKAKLGFALVILICIIFFNIKFEEFN